MPYLIENDQNTSFDSRSCELHVPLSQRLRSSILTRTISCASTSSTVHYVRNCCQTPTEDQNFISYGMCWQDHEYYAQRLYQKTGTVIFMWLWLWHCHKKQHLWKPSSVHGICHCILKCDF